MQETQVQSLGWEDPLEKETATHSTTLAWKIPWVEGLAGYSPRGLKESDTTKRLHLLCTRNLKDSTHTQAYSQLQRGHKMRLGIRLVETGQGGQGDRERSPVNPQ